MSPPTSQPTYECGQCDTTFSTLSSLKSHFYATHVILQDTPSSTDPQQPPSSSSPLASDDDEDLIPQADQEDPTTSNLYHCEVKSCGKTFEKKQDRDRHEIRGHVPIHLRPESLTCEICNKTLGHSYSMKEHMRTHTKEMPHVCNLCGKGFTHAGSLRSHLKSQKHGGPGLSHYNKKKPKKLGCARKRGRKKKVQVEEETDEDDDDVSEDGDDDQQPGTSAQMNQEVTPQPVSAKSRRKSPSNDQIVQPFLSMPTLQLVEHQPPQSSSHANNYVPPPPLLVPQVGSHGEQYQHQQFWKFVPQQQPQNIIQTTTTFVGYQQQHQGFYQGS